MTTAHRPTWAPAVGGEEQGGMRIFVPSRAVSAKNLPGHLKLKFRCAVAGASSALEDSVRSVARQQTGLLWGVGLVQTFGPPVDARTGKTAKRAWTSCKRRTCARSWRPRSASTFRTRRASTLRVGCAGGGCRRERCERAPVHVHRTRAARGMLLRLVATSLAEPPLRCFPPVARALFCSQRSEKKTCSC